MLYEPHLIEPMLVDMPFHFEILRIKESRIFISQFEKRLYIEEILKTASDFRQLAEHARKLLTCFPSTYSCESSFSNMNAIKFFSRSQITDSHLEDRMISKNTKIVRIFIT